MRWWLLVLALVFVVSVGAQDNAQEDITVAPIAYGSIVQNDITDTYFYDWWVFNGQAGHEIEVMMTGAEGLAPLIGLLSPTRELIARSDEGEADGVVTLSYTLPATGEYILVATRAGNEGGDTVGLYTLQLSLRPQVENRVNPYREVEFNCSGDYVDNVLTLELQDDPEQTPFVGVTVYGLDGFVPVLRTTLTFDFEPFFDQFCITPDGEGSGYGEGDTLQLPDADMLNITAGATVKTNFADAPDFGVLQLNVGSWDGQAGRFVVVVDGFTVGEGGDRDLVNVGLGPLIRDSVLDVYMISDKGGRLDPALELTDENYNQVRLCDDAGLRDCDDVPPIDGFVSSSVEYERTITANRFDAGLRLMPESPDKINILAGGFDGRTSGDYVVVMIGEYGGNQTDE